MARQTLEQQRALYALQTVQRHAQDKYASQYGTLVRSLPSMVLQNGLGQALAYLLAATGGKGVQAQAARALYEELQDWLGPVSHQSERPDQVYREGTDLMAALMAGSRAEYQQAQQTALALLGWMRKFADAYLPEHSRPVPGAEE
ncbi:MAG: type III-B CRISPR module-associated protein Cmr5 [Chloroflexi bacterium]|nr:type III-B CRISPR module-associated protein Cmr5 [Chloroflexota bacterium]